MNCRIAAVGRVLVSSGESISIAQSLARGVTLAASAHWLLSLMPEAMLMRENDRLCARTHAEFVEQV